MEIAGPAIPKDETTLAIAGISYFLLIDSTNRLINCINPLNHGNTLLIDGIIRSINGITWLINGWVARRGPLSHCTAE